MPVKIGTKSYKNQKEAASALKKRRPDIKDPNAYVATVERIIEQRRAAKNKKK